MAVWKYVVPDQGNIQSVKDIRLEFFQAVNDNLTRNGFQGGTTFYNARPTAVINGGDTVYYNPAASGPAGATIETYDIVGAAWVKIV